MRGQAGPSAKELKSKADFNKFIENDDVSVVGIFETESKLKDSFLKVADTERDRFRFGYTSDPEVIKSTGYTEYVFRSFFISLCLFILFSDIVVYVPKKLQNKFDPNEFKYDGNYDTDKIKNFLVHETNGLAGVRTQGNLFQFVQRPLVVVYYNVDYVKDPKGSNYWRNRVLKVAQDYKRKVYFAVSNKEEFGNEIEQFGLADRKESDKPLIAAFGKDGGKYPLNKEFSIDNLKQFVDDLLADKLESYMKSEPVPEEQGDLKVAVGRNFKELITDSGKDALIEFYAPWCGHCKSLAPTYEKLASTLADEDVVIAKFDATANDVPPGFDVRGFPTLFWLPKNSDTPVPYNSGRELKDFIKFIAKHSTDGLKGYSREGKKIKKKTDEL